MFDHPYHKNIHLYYLYFMEILYWDFFSSIWGPFYQHDFTLIKAWISSYMLSNVWDEITYSFSNFNIMIVKVLGMDTQFHPTFYFGCNNLSTLWSKSNHVPQEEI